MVKLRKAPAAGRCADCWVPYAAGTEVVPRGRKAVHVDCQAPEVMALVVNTAATVIPATWAVAA